MIKKFLIPLLLLLFSFWQLNAYTKSYWVSSHDGIFHALRIREFYFELTHGQFPVRWTDQLDNNYGIPTFNFIYPGPYLLGSIPMALGSNERDSYKMVMFFGYFIGVLGFYYLFKNKDRFLATLAGILYGLTPYLFLNIFIRGALGEVLAMGLMPWVIYGFLNRKKFISIFSLFFLVLSHNFLGPLFLVFLICLLIWNHQFDKFVLKNILYSIGLSSFFLLPMILENKFIVSGATSSFTFDFRQHFVYLQQLLYGKWDYWYSLPGPNDGVSYQLGFANIAIIFLSILFLFISKSRKKILFLIISVVFTIFLTLTFSQPIWELIKPLQIMQFPWRFFFLSTILFPLLFFTVFTSDHNKLLFKNRLFPILLVILALVNTRNYRRPMEFQGPEKYQQWLDVYDHKTTTAARSEISPKWTLKEKYSGGKIILTDSSKVVPITSSIPENIYFSIENQSQPEQITILKNYFPGWILQNISRDFNYDIKPDNIGNITATIDNGNYRLYYDGTFLEHLSNLISVITLLILLISSIKLLPKI